MRSIGIYSISRIARPSTRLARYSLWSLIWGLECCSRLMESAWCHSPYVTEPAPLRNCRKNLYVRRWIWCLAELSNNEALKTKFWMNSTVFLFNQICHRDGGMQNTLTQVSQNSVTHCLISWHCAINYAKAATTNFCGAVLDDKWNVQAATSEKLPSFFHGWILLTLMMYNSLQLHLTCALNGSTNCLPRVMKKKTANQARDLKCVH